MRHSMEALGDNAAPVVSGQEVELPWVAFRQKNKLGSAKPAFKTS